MNIDLYRKKQVILPDLFYRTVTLLFDLTILAFILNAPTQQISFYLFKLNFTNFIEANKLVLNTVQDIQLIYTNENLASFPSLMETLVFWGQFLFIQYLMISLYFIFCWNRFGTTMGKYIFKIKIADYTTGKNPSLIKSIIRYFSYIFFPISFFMIIFGKEKRAVHDFFANTIVMKY